MAIESYRVLREQTAHIEVEVVNVVDGETEISRHDIAFRGDDQSGYLWIADLRADGTPGEYRQLCGSKSGLRYRGATAMYRDRSDKIGNLQAIGLPKWALA